MAKDFSFFIYDYESFGVNPATDRPAQFAGIRTDFDFNIINGHIDKTANANIGTLFVQLIGSKENTDKVIARLNELGILTEVL